MEVALSPDGELKEELIDNNSGKKSKVVVTEAVHIGIPRMVRGAGFEKIIYDPENTHFYDFGIIESSNESVVKRSLLGRKKILDIETKTFIRVGV